MLFYGSLPDNKPKTEKNTGGDFHVHLDGPATGWVAIASLGCNAEFCVDDSRRCHRFFHEGKCPASGMKQAKDMQRWKTCVCATCIVIELQSGDIALFSGNPRSRCAHGVLGVGTRRRQETAGHALPAYLHKARVSVQVRNLAVGQCFENAAGHYQVKIHTS